MGRLTGPMIHGINPQELGLDAIRLLGVVALLRPDLCRALSRETIRREAAIVLLADRLAPRPEPSVPLESTPR